MSTTPVIEPGAWVRHAAMGVLRIKSLDGRRRAWCLGQGGKEFHISLDALRLANPTVVEMDLVLNPGGPGEEDGSVDAPLEKPQGQEVSPSQEQEEEPWERPGQSWIEVHCAQCGEPKWVAPSVYARNKSGLFFCGHEHRGQYQRAHVAPRERGDTQDPGFSVLHAMVDILPSPGEGLSYQGRELWLQAVESILECLYP